MTDLQSFDRVADVYDATRGFPPEAEARVAAGLAELLAPGSRLIEVGVGTGRVAAPLAAHGIAITGIDISRKMLEILGEKTDGVMPVLAEAGHLPFRDGTFDAGLFVHILHLVPDVEGTIRETVRVIRPGGTLLACATSYGPNAGQEAGEIIRRAISEVAGHTPPPFNSNDRSTVAEGQGERGGRGRLNRSEPPFLRAMAEIGANLTERELARWRVASTARGLLDEVLAQLHSQTWSIPVALLPEIVERAQPGVVAVMGGLDTRVEAEAVFRVHVARLPGG